MKINIRNLKGIYTNQDTRDTNPEYAHDSVNISYEKGYVETKGFNILDYTTLAQISPIGSLDIQALEFVNLSSDKLREKNTSYTKRYAILVNKVQGPNYEVWASEFKGNSYVPFAKVTSPIPLNNYFTEDKRVQIIAEKGEARILLPTASLSMKLSGGILTLRPSVDTGSQGFYDVSKGFTAVPSTKEYADANKGFARRIPIGMYTTNLMTKFLIFAFVKCDAEGKIVQTEDAYLDVQTEFKNGKYYDETANVMLRLYDYGVFETTFGENCTDNFVPNPVIPGLNESIVLLGLKNCFVYASAGKKFFVTDASSTMLADPFDQDHDGELIEWKDSEELMVTEEPKTSYFEYFHPFDCFYNTDKDFRQTDNLMVYAVGNGGKDKTSESGFNTPMDMIVTATIDEVNEVVVLSNTIKETGKYLISCSYNPENLHKAVTRLRIYLKARVYSETEDEVYSEDSLSDYYLYKDINLLEKKSVKNSFDLSGLDNTGIALTQMIGTFYDSNYGVLSSIDDRAFIDGVSYALKDGIVYPCAVGGGRIMTDVFYKSSFLEVPYSESVIEMVNVNNQLALATRKGLVFVHSQKVGEALNFQVKDTMDIIIKDYADIAETMDGTYFHTKQGIIFTNGYERKTVSESINDIIESNYEKGNIFYNAARSELYYCFDASTLYRYCLMKGFWEPLRWTGKAASPNLLEVKEDFRGEIVVHNRVSIMQGSLVRNTSYSSLNFQTLDLGDIPSMKNLIAVHIDCEIGKVKDDGTSKAELYFGLQIGKKDVITGEVDLDSIKYPSVSIPISLKGGDNKYYNAFTGRRSLTIPVPLERKYWTVPEGLTDIPQAGSGTLIATRVPSTRITLQLNLRNIEFRIYNIEIEYDFLTGMNPEYNRSLGYGTFYGSRYGIHL